MSQTLSRLKGSPRAYLVALHDDGQQPRAHLFAFGRHGAELQIQEELERLTIPAPWRTPVRLLLRRRGTVMVPADVFLAPALARRQWFGPGALEAFRRRWSRFGVPLGNFNRPEATWFRDPPAFPAGDGALWRSGRSVFVVDLDRLRFVQAGAIAWSALPLGLRPVWGYEAAIDQGRGFEYAGPSGTFGTFHSAAESRNRWRGERAAAREDFVPGSAIVHPGRRPFVRQELGELAAQRGTSPEHEWRAEVRLAFEAVLAECVTAFFERLAKAARSRPDDPLPAVKKAWPRAYRSLLTTLRWALVDYTLASILPGRRRAYETSREEPMRNGVESTGTTADADPGALEDDPLERIAREEILDALRPRLTPAELEAFDAELRDEDRRSFARRTGRSPRTVDVLWRRIREKAKKLRSQM
jgi:hypothetical protein